MQEDKGVLLLVEELYSSNLPVEFLDTLEKSCRTCGSPTAITPTLTRLQCTNDDCLEKATQRLFEMLQDLGVYGVDLDVCERFLKHFCGNSDYNPCLILAYDPSEDGVLYEGCSFEFSKEVYEQLNVVRSMPLWKYISAGIGDAGGVRNKAESLCKGYNSLDDFYKDLDTGGIGYVQKQLGDSSDDNVVSLEAISVYETLLRYRIQLYEAVSGVHIIMEEEFV